jgi:hypothetical protein
MYMRRFALLSFLAVSCSGVAARGDLLNFAAQPLASANSFLNGNPDTITNSNGFTSGNFYLNNDFTSTGASAGEGYWDGWSLTNQNNSGAGYNPLTDNDLDYQYAAYPGSGPDTADLSATYTVNSEGGYINLPSGQVPISVDLTNDTYTALSMLYGDSYSKKFGPSDYFDVTLTGYSEAAATGAATGSTTFYLAQNGSIVDSWVPVNLTGLGDASSIAFSYGSSDVGAFGVNTPEYVALDDLATAPVPEPASLGLIGVGGITLLGRTRRRGQAC